MQESISTTYHSPAKHTDTAQTVSTIIESLGNFFTNPTISNKVVAVRALQAHLAVIEAGRQYR